MTKYKALILGLKKTLDMVHQLKFFRDSKLAGLNEDQRWKLLSLLSTNLEEDNSVEVIDDEKREDWI